MRGRVVVPIRDHHSRILAFAGRKVEACESAVEKCLREQGSSEEQVSVMMERWNNGKWINESYPKKNFLYGLGDHKLDIFQQGFAVVVEGQLDAIVTHMEGIHNVVAIGGTATNLVQLARLARYASHLVLALDRDEAGQRAAERLLGLVQKRGMTAYSVMLPAAMDPENALRSERYHSPFLWAIREAGQRREGTTGVIDLSSPATLLAAQIYETESKPLQEAPPCQPNSEPL